MDSNALHDQTPVTEETWASRSSYTYLGHATHVSEPRRDAPLYLVLLVCSDALHDQMPATEEAWATGVVMLAWTVHPYSQTLPCCTHGEEYFFVVVCF